MPGRERLGWTGGRWLCGRFLGYGNLNTEGFVGVVVEMPEGEGTENMLNNPEEVELAIPGREGR